ncbi:zinc finger protein 281 [Chanos chanos]|uniref:Zinc finger protein 281 n=1 Tax=Chanos chanos TaxID=29144 RepID=A0A6J2WZU1_CHACN|nr:zinc finger protein 281-like [Chanos chanos]
MSLIQDKLGGEFLRSNGGMEPGFSAGMIMFSHLPPVTSFTRLASQTVMTDLQPHEMILKKERDSPDCGGGGGGMGGGMGGGGGGGMGMSGMLGGIGDYVHSMGIKQEKMSEHDYRLPYYPGGGVGSGGGRDGGGGGGGGDLLQVSLGTHQNLLAHDLSLGNLSGRLVKEPSGKRGRRSNGDGQEGKTRRKRGESKSMMLDADGESLSPNSKPHICEHCNAAFRSSYHLRRHVLIHTGERPFRCSQCNMSFIQKYLLQRHEKIHSGEKPFGCDQCNMRFIQKYHMERHRRTHSGEKPYKCDTCQQYFSRTDRLLKHKRTCGDTIKKGLDGTEPDLGDSGHGSYGITQGNAAASGRKRGKSKNPGEGGERKRKRGGGAGAGGVAAATAGAATGSGVMEGAHAQGSGGFGLHGFNSMENHGGVSSSSSAPQPGPSMHGEHGRAPKMAFKKGNRKGQDKNAQHAQLEQPKTSGMDLSGGTGLDGLGLLQGPGAKSGPTSSNYDDAMQFLKKRRYLHAANNGGGGTGATDYDVGVGHLQPQPTVIQGGVSGVMDGDTSLGLLDSSPLAVDIKQDKSGIPDEVLQSLLDHYAHKPDVTFDLSDHHHVELQPASADGPMGHEDDPPSPSGGDKSVIMHEYSRFLLQALERTSHNASFPLGPSPPGISTNVTGPFSVPAPLFSDKHVYTTSPLECTFGQSVVSSPSLSSSSSSVPKSHFTLLGSSSPPQSFHLSGLEPSAHTQPPPPPPPTQQQLTPSQELTEQLEKQHTPTPPPPSQTPSTSTYQIPPPPQPPTQSDMSGQKEAQGSKNRVASSAGGFSLAPSQGLGALDSAKTSYQIENFAQAFGAQFKGSRVPLAFGSDSGGEVDHRIRTPVSEFSGYSSLLADVSDPVSTASKTLTSQSYR